MNTSRILLAAILIIGASGAVIGGSGAFFSDRESSTGNTFTAGTLDLKVDNDSYYNGNRCTNIGTEEVPNYVWQGESGFPEPGTPCETSFPQSDLDDGFVFFNFNDLKPDDEGEDTISLHVQNDAWACMDLTLTSNDDNGSNEPELEVDEADDENDAWDGELGSTLEFFWWADDGDNVYEEGEEQISDGVQSLIDLAPQGDSFQVALADSAGNVWGDTEPLPANETVYIAKAWCMGDLTLNPVAAGQGVNPQVATGVTCDGEDIGNVAQTDGVELTVTFTAIQARHNPDFLCADESGGQEESATLTVNKIIVADTEGIGVEDFQLHINGPDGDQIVSDNIPNQGLTPGAYEVSEVIIEAGLPPGVTFTTTFGGACDEDGNVTLADGDNKVCTITNTENAPTPVLTESFGTGTCATDIAGWDEDAGESCANGTVAAAIGVGDDTVSPDGGRFAMLSGNNGYICRSVDATGLSSLQLKYYWRGDMQAEDGETGSVKYATGGTCAAPTGPATLATHELDDGDNNLAEAWSPLQTINLPGSLDNTTFLLLFSADSNGGNESFRVDGVSLTGL
jgi:predicted ribosomally synthesized peptide with SipW-like signal peptide